MVDRVSNPLHNAIPILLLIGSHAATRLRRVRGKEWLLFPPFSAS